MCMEIDLPCKLTDLSQLGPRSIIRGRGMQLVSIQQGEATLLTGEDHPVLRPRPATELSPPVVRKGLLHLTLCVHDKGAYNSSECIVV